MCNTWKPVIVTATVQRCCECGWSMSPALLAHDLQTNSDGFYCLTCFADASNRGAFTQPKEVLS